MSIIATSNESSENLNLFKNTYQLLIIKYNTGKRTGLLKKVKKYFAIFYCINVPRMLSLVNFQHLNFSIILLRLLILNSI